MLKFFYRLKKRGGVVLFAVVAIMTLLIVMASVAYFTARSSYQTVLSNYDFSQTYLSATSVADMVLSSVAFDTSRTADNEYSGLRTLIGKLETDATTDLTTEAAKYTPDKEVDVTEIHYTDGIDTKKIVFYNKNVDGDKNYKDFTPGSEAGLTALKNSVTIKGASHTDTVSGKFGDDLLDASMNDPVKGGVIDGCEVTISLDWVKALPVDKEEDKYTSNRYYYTFTTTAYYRGNSVTVSDTVYHDSTLGGSPGLPQFDTFFTATGQTLGDKGKVKQGADRLVVINTHQISDSAYFQNNDTVITRYGGSAADVNFAGGLRTSGNLWLDGDTGGTFPKPSGERRHDWIIGGDLYVSGNSKLDFNGNCLYVKGDLFLCTASAPFKNLGAVVVEGNIYVMNGSVTAFTYSDYSGIDAKHQVTQGCFVQGTKASDTGVPGGIYNVTETTNSSTYVYDYITLNDPSDTMPDKYKNYPTDNTKIYEKYGKYHKKTDGTEMEKTWYEDVDNGDGTTVRVWHHTLSIADYIHGVINSKIKESTTKAGFSSFELAKSYGSGVNTFSAGKLRYNNGTGGLVVNDTNHSSKRVGDYEDIKGQISKLEAVESGGDSKYEYKLTTGVKVSDILSPDGGLAKRDFDSYSAKQSAVDNVLIIDFSTITSKGKHTFTSTKGETATVEVTGADNLNNCKEVNIDLPASETGYILKITGTKETNWDGSTKIKVPWQQSGAVITYKIHTLDDVSGKHKTMPIILAANFNDGDNVWNPNAENEADRKYGTPVDEKGNNCFSWKFGDFSNDANVRVELTNKAGTGNAQGFVIFEMGNYTAGGGYQLYNKNNAASLETVVFRSSWKEFIGTKDQVEYFVKQSGDSVSESTLLKMLKDKELGTLNTAYTEGGRTYNFDNKIILVSNKNDSRLAYSTAAWDKNGNIKGSDSCVLCGYFYAPNGMFAAPAGNTTYPFFGGMIVSDYTIVKNKFMYAMPDPDLVQGLADGLTNITSVSTEGKNAWYVDGSDLGKNYLG